jgi:hypothetical protein
MFTNTFGKGKNMKRSAAVLALFAASACAFSALPTLGYSASSGFIFGGFLVFPLSSPPGQFTINTYYGTAGVIKFQPEMIKVYDAGILSTSLGYRKVLGKEWFGWGNQTDPDSFATMDFEKADLLASFTVPADHFSFTGGLDVRHSCVFNREQSALWGSLSQQSFASTWSAGLNGRIDYTTDIPVNGDILLSTGGFFQAGDVSYSGLSGKVRGTVRPWSGGEIALGTRVHKQFNAGEAPIPYVAGIGQNENFRGYKDYRFTGTVWNLSQFEVRQDLFTLGKAGSDQALTVGLTVFAEAGEAAEEFSELSVNSLHTDYGCGLNIKLDSSAQMRLDAAWSEEGMLIQSAFGRSF